MILLIAVLALGTPFVEIAVVLLATMAITELFNATKLSDNKIMLVTSLVGTVGLVTVQAFDGALFSPAMYAFMAVLFIVYMINMSKIMFRDVAETFFLTIYVSFMFGHVMLVRSAENGHLLIWLVFVGAFITDTAAMFGGKFFGRHKLCPKLSPKKTIEGSLCGIAGCVVATLIYCVICQIGFKVTPNYLWAVVVGFGASIVAQVGDLSASCIKRQFGIKDYGKIMPGHGGIMDRCDSLIFVAPFVYYMMLIFPFFG